MPPTSAPTMQVHTLLTAALLLTSLSAQSSLTTMFTGGNSLNSPGSNQFDVTVLNQRGIVITGFDVNCENTRNGPVGSAFEIDVYITAPGGTYVANETNAAQWLLASHGTGISNTLGSPTPVDIDDLFLPPGHYGVALQYKIPTGGVGTAYAYTNGTGANQQFVNNDLQLDLGSACTGVFAGPVYTPRIWNGTVYYEAGRTAAYGIYGSGCSGGSPTGAPTLRPGAAFPVPRIGAQFDLEVGNLGAMPCPGFMIYGMSVTQWGPFTLPLDMTIFGMPGCTGLVSMNANLLFVNAGLGPVTWTIGIPNNPALAGLALGNQAMLLDPLATNAAGVNFTNLAAGRVGL